jgi:hypothetical protein
MSRPRCDGSCEGYVKGRGEVKPWFPRTASTRGCLGAGGKGVGGEIDVSGMTLNV